MRTRTTMTEKQLQILRACYNANHRPDALLKEQLVEMTQLKPRVISVWFINKRCKDKKKQIYLNAIAQGAQVSPRNKHGTKNLIARDAG